MLAELLRRAPTLLGQRPQGGREVLPLEQIRTFLVDVRGLEQGFDHQIDRDLPIIPEHRPPPPAAGERYGT